jgi:hypothetical protein
MILLKKPTSKFGREAHEQNDLVTVQPLEAIRIPCHGVKPAIIQQNHLLRRAPHDASNADTMNSSMQLVTVTEPFLKMHQLEVTSQAIRIGQDRMQLQIWVQQPILRRATNAQVHVRTCLEHPVRQQASVVVKATDPLFTQRVRRSEGEQVSPEGRQVLGQGFLGPKFNWSNTKLFLNFTSSKKAVVNVRVSNPNQACRVELGRMSFREPYSNLRSK